MRTDVGQYQISFFRPRLQSINCFHSKSIDDNDVNPCAPFTSILTHTIINTSILIFNGVKKSFHTINSNTKIIILVRETIVTIGYISDENNIR